MADGARAASDGGGADWLRIASATALSIVVAVIVWLVLKDDGDSEPAVPASTASAATLATLRALPGEVGHDVYWVGPRPTFTYELTELTGRVFIRYLPLGIPVGDPRPDYLTIGTYSVRTPYRNLRRRAGKPGTGFRAAAGGGIAVWSRDRPQSVYLAYRRSTLQIEVFDPSAARARRLATSGAVRPIG
jgi:hypothetical protein